MKCNIKGQQRRREVERDKKCDDGKEEKENNTNKSEQKSSFSFRKEMRNVAQRDYRTDKMKREDWSKQK